MVKKKNGRYVRESSPHVRDNQLLRGVGLMAYDLYGLMRILRITNLMTLMCKEISRF
jgi:hypothetical protein